jgi:serine/threonine protein kinase/tetratricopeptide (TPR) repeat protein
VVDLLEPHRLEQLRVALADRYEIDRKLGEGGMASVYLARDPRHGRQVAVKVLREDLAASIGSARFLHEVQVAANLQHPHILALYDSGEARGFLYYVMPYVEGESLRQRLEREHRLPLPETVRIAREAAEGLAYAHRQGIIHRDVKPENILLLDGHTLVADFGIARAVEAPAGGKLTHPGAVVGTPEYMSPEQAAGETQLDGRSDVYSLGCVLYEMLAGDPPFQGRSMTTLLARHSLEQVPSLRIVRESIPEELEDTVLGALAKTAADRPSMAELAATLTGLQETTLRTSTRPVTARAPARRWRNIARLRAIAVTAVMLLLATWIFIALRQSERPRHARTPAELDPSHIAVLYFDQRPKLDSLAYLADGVTEELIHELSGIAKLHVISRYGVAPYRGTTVPPDSIARALNVGTLVHGTVTALADRLRLNVSLIEGATGAEIASTSFERPHQQIFALQEDLASEVAVFLRRRLGEEVKLRETRVRSARHDPRAWHLFQHAEELSKDVDPLLGAGDTAGAAGRLHRSDSLLKRAEAVEPGWIRPAISRGWLAFKQLDVVGTFDKAHYQRWTAAGLVHAERALRMDSTDPDGLELRGTLRYYRWLFNLVPDSAASAALLDQAEADLQGATEANPGAAFGLSLLSHLLMAQSRTAQAKLAALRAYEADPYLATARQTIWRLFQTSLELEQSEEARRWCQEGQRRFPEYYRFTECRLWVFALKDQQPDIDQLWRLYGRYREVIPPNAVFNRHYGLMLVAIALARAGLRDSAVATALRARADSSVDQTRDLALLEAIARTILEDRDEALRLLDVYLTANPHLRESMARDESWWWKDLRADPRYREIVGSESRQSRDTSVP